MDAVLQRLRDQALAGEAGALSELSRLLSNSGPIGARYASGDTAGAWEALIALGSAVHEPHYAKEASAIAWETMRRVRHNLRILLARLDNAGYQRAFPGALGPPVTPQDLSEIERHIEGPLPLSLRAFWEVVGSVNLTQSERQIAHDWLEKPPSEVACLGDDDPLVVPPPSSLYFELFDPWEKDEHGRHCVTFSSDRFHKGHVSGGPGYGLWIPDGCADFRIEGDVCPTDEGLPQPAPGRASGQFFVRMLRDTMAGGGFRGPVDRTQLKAPLWRTRTLPLRPLQRQLASGLLPM